MTKHQDESNTRVRGGAMDSQLCVQCGDESNPVTVENGVSVPDAGGKVVMPHVQCADVWILKRSSQPNSAADSL